jgi:hypothetical protein
MRSGLALALVALVAGACHSTTTTVLVVTVTLSGSLPPVAALRVRLNASGAAEDQTYGSGGTITFPTTLVAELPTRIAGDLGVEVRATDADGKILATGSTPFQVRVGAHQNVKVRLECGVDVPCSLAGGGGVAGPGADAGGDFTDGTCGNGRIDVDETCDTAISLGAPGACPPASCDDGVACTTNMRVGQGCQARCTYQEITKAAPGDKCCPTGATPATDVDCSPTCGNGTVEAGEVCDTGIVAGAPGACPSAATCDDGDPCTSDFVRAAGTCSASCQHVPITMQTHGTLDGCCPAGAWHAVDADCPRACGDGQLDVPDETCDPGFPATDPRACPTACDDGDPCTLDVLQGSACQRHCVSTPITAFVSGDGCCPVHATARTDHDCAPVCGNDVVEPGESCDNGPGSPEPCKTSCGPSPTACLKNVLVGSAATCTARCELAPVTACDAKSDGCCPPGCTPATDPDCSASCGDGVVQSGEMCDIAIPAGKPGACPTSCADSSACTRDVLLAPGTCQARCFFAAITAPRAGDGCCPAGADASLDPDCPPLCGNGAVELPGETCDYGAGPTACPTTCGGGDACTPIRLEGSVGTCNASCVAHPVTACISNDGCCPAWCTIANDADCPALCGDAVLTPGEACDRAITAGLPGACARTCDDGDACTADWASGTIEGCSRACSHAPITACRGGDGCCPAGCNASSDSDCAPRCGDGQIGAGETCDPPATCPSTCPDDGDPCTREVLRGKSADCTAVCRHEPVTTCSGATADLCCPSICTADTDVDCSGPGPNP